MIMMTVGYEDVSYLSNTYKLDLKTLFNTYEKTLNYENDMFEDSYTFLRKLSFMLLQNHDGNLM